MVTLRSVALMLSASLLSCTTVIREDDGHDSNCTCMTSAAPGGDDPDPGGDPVDTADEPDTSAGTTTSDGAGSESGSDSSGQGGALCGNGFIEGAEECDCGEGNVCSEKELGGQGCVGLEDPTAPGVLTGGVLLCNAASCRYDTANCFYCGDGAINGNETCEPGFDIETSCGELGLGLGSLACGGDCQLDTSDCNACGFVFDFDSGDCPGDWETGRTTPAAAPTSWECGAAGGDSSGPGFSSSLMWGTNLSGPHEDNASGYLASPELAFAACADQTVTMTVRHWFNLEVGDGGVVQVATADPEDEASWTTIEPFAGSFYTATVAANHPPVAGNPAFSTFDAAEGTWVNAEFDLTDYAGQSGLYVRFVFGSDDSGASGGWYVDNVEILGVPR